MLFSRVNIFFFCMKSISWFLYFLVLSFQCIPTTCMDTRSRPFESDMPNFRGIDVLLPNETSAFMDTVQWEGRGDWRGVEKKQQKTMKQAEIWTFERIFCVAALRGDISSCESLSSSHKLFSHCDGNFQLVYLALVCQF